ncbi:MAG: DUF1501 domain-containing protein [Verrucomicrobium sp.]|nr:DUF1501 domain-containing protein [Verrucomicrobium sp.]
MHHPCLHTRRDFLRTTLLGGALTWTVPTFLADTFSTLHAAAFDSATQIATGKDAPILVLLQLAGGNDGLNTLIPYANDFYYQARPTLAVKPGDVLKLDGQVGLHPSLVGFKALYDSGNLGVIQGVGYPNPNRSHFRSTEIWETASDSGRNVHYGWIGRYFDNACSGSDPTVGVSISSEMPQAFWSPLPKGVALRNPGSYRFDSGRRAGMSDDLTEAYYKELNLADGSNGDHSPGDMEGASIGKLSSGSMTAGASESPLRFIERTALDAQVSSDKILSITKAGQNRVVYPQSALANDLKLVARLIDGGLSSRVYFVSQGSYDTHRGQAGTHPRNLKDLGDALLAFCNDLKAQRNFDRVVVMTFSEFGRRVHENGSGGTDHGTASPQFIFGGRVKAGLAGAYPSLDPAGLDHGDLVHTVDFRSVYAGLLENWLKTDSQPVLQGRFQPLSMVV